MSRIDCHGSDSLGWRRQMLRFSQSECLVAASSCVHLTSVPLEVIRVREEAPPVRSGEQLVARPGVSDYLAVRVDRIPMQGREDGMLAELASVDLDRRPPNDTLRDAVGDDRLGEVISHRGAVWHVDRLSFSDREEWPEAEIGHAFDIAI